MFCTTSFSSIARACSRHRLFAGGWCKRGLIGDCRGVAALEFGILLPFMIVLLAGIADLGRGIWQHEALVKGAAEAGRYLSRVPVDCSGGGSIAASDWTAAKNIALRDSYDASLDYPFAFWATSVTSTLTIDCSFTNSSGGVAVLRGQAGTPIPTITVKFTVNPPASEFPLLSTFGPGTIRYSARSMVRNIGE